MADSSPLVSPEGQDGARKKVSLEAMSKEELIKQVKKQLILLQKTKSKFDELNKRIAELEEDKQAVAVSGTSTDEISLLECSIREKEAAIHKSLSENEQLKQELQVSEELCTQLQKEKNLVQEQFDCIELKVQTMSETCQVLQQECSTSHQEKQDLLNQVEVLTEARDTSLNSLKELKHQSNASREQMELQREQLKKTEAEQQLLIGRLEDCCAQLEEANKQNVNMQEDYAKMRTRWRDAADETFRMKIETEDRLREQAEQCEELRKQMHELFLELEGAKAKIGELQDENAEKTDTVFCLENRLQKMDGEMPSLLCERDDLKSKIAGLVENKANEHKLNDEIETLKSELKSYQNRCKEVEQMWEQQEKTGSNFREEMLPLKSEDNEENVGNWITEKERYIKEIENLNSEKVENTQTILEMQQELNASIQQWKTENDDLVKNIDGLNLEKEEYCKQLLQTKTDMEAQIIQLKSEKDQLKDTLNGAECKHESRQSERFQEVENSLMQQLQEAMKNIQLLKEDLQKTHNQKQDAVEELLQLKDLQKFLEDEAKALREECEKTKIEIKRLDADLENDSLHIRHLEKELRETEERETLSNKESESLRNHLCCMEEALQAAEKQLEENSKVLEKDLHFYREKLDQVDSEYQNSTSRVFELQTQVQELVVESETLKSENIELKELSSVLQNRTDEMKAEEWEKEKDCLEEQIALLKDTNEKLHLELVELRETLFMLRDMEGLIEAQLPEPEKKEPLAKADSGFHSQTDVFDCEGGVVPIAKREPHSENDELREVNEDLRMDLRQAKERSTELQEEVDTKSQMMEKMLIEMNNLLSQIDDLNAVIDEKDHDLASVARKLTAQTESARNMELDLKVKDDTLISLKTEHQERIDQDSEVLKNTEAKLVEMSVKYESLSVEMDQAITQRDLLQEKVSLLSDGSEENKNKYEQEIQNWEAMLESLRGELSLAKSTNVQLQEQVDVLNKELEEGSENALHANEQLALLCRQLEESESNSSQTNQQLETLKSCIKKLEDDGSALTSENNSIKTAILDLEEEVKRLQQLLDSNSLDSKEDLQMVASTQPSTTEEELKQQLKTSEEKMAKFKALAVKVKKEMVDIKRDRDKFAKQTEELSSLSRQHLLNFQSLQVEHDKLQDACDSMSQELTSTVSEVNALKVQNSEIKSENSKLQSALDVANLEKKSADQARSEAESKVIILKSEKDANQKKFDLVKAESSKTSQRMKSLEEQLAQEKEQHKQTTQKLEQKLQEAKQQSFLDLEIADYEHSISEINEKLQTKDIEISVLQEELSRQAERISSLTEQIGYLEAQRDIEEERAKSLKTSLAKAKEEAVELKESNTEQQKKILASKMELEAIIAVKEDFQVQLAEGAVEITKLQESLRNAKESHSRTAKSYETRLASLEEALAHSKSEFESNKQEFESYKVRVHSVLKQKQQPLARNVIEPEGKQRLEKMIEQLRLKLQQLSDELNARNVEMETLQQGHDHLSTRHTRVVSDFQQKEENWIHKIEILKKDHEHQQAMWETHKKQLLYQLDMVEANFKKQMLDQETSWKMEVRELQSKLTEKENELRSCQRENLVAPLHSPNEDAPFDILTQERQDGEGSECADTLPHYKPLSLVTIPTSGFTPLEQLLQSSSDPENTEIIHQDAESLSANLTAAYKKLDHLTELLNESEASNMRMSEQVRILKEEIRRVERNKEREEHSGNLEYLKNIVLKFLLLQGSSERERLLPVLSTILRLSPEEQAQIQTTTIGATLDDASSSGWGSYLHRWSGLM